jgi:ABC-type transporter Mla subunit MlaD
MARGKQIPVSVPDELRDVAERLDRLASRYADLLEAAFEGNEPSLQDDARVFRQTAATARTGADEITQLLRDLDRPVM